MWKVLRCAPEELNLKLVLDGGQSFRWKTMEKDDDIWYGVLNRNLWLLKQTSDAIHYQVHKDCKILNKDPVNEEEISLFIETDEQFLHSYFQLDIDVKKLYKHWCTVDKNLEKLHSGRFYGIRVLKQDPVENLFSFICSQNNNINRISQLVHKLCIAFGEKICCHNDEFYLFPTVENLAQDGVEKTLRGLGFGYRAKFIEQAAKYIVNKHGGQEWLFGLRAVPYEEAHQALCSLPGVGAKVADCVCLMSLNKTSAIPVDTHMWQIASKHYLSHLSKNKNVTSKAYKEIRDFFRDLYGEYSGWAHSVLFTADLKKNQTPLEKKPKSVKRRKGHESSLLKKRKL